jgi:hypothetical protein
MRKEAMMIKEICHFFFVGIYQAREKIQRSERFYRLWDLRKESTENLSRAMDEDDTDMFGKHESQIRHFNKQMHKVKANYLKLCEMKRINELYQRQSASKYVSVDDLSLGERTPFRKRSHKETGDGQFEIKLNYQGNQVIRQAHRSTLNRVVHYLGLQYLREVFSLSIDSVSKNYDDPSRRYFAETRKAGRCTCCEWR